jgi:hypothetical protein
LSGFAKLQLDLPEGFSVKEIDNKGANFTFTDGIAKWVWASLPADNELVVKANLVASSTATGVKTIGGKYSYVENNGKQVVEMTPAEITIGDDNSTTATTIQTTNTETAKTPTTESTTTASTSTNTNAEPNANISVQRTIVKNSDTEYTINLKIKKGATKGFARYSDDLPETFTAKSSKTDGSSFSVADGKIKFVWVTVPVKEELDVSYTISGSSATPLPLNGEYSFLEENQSKKYKLTPETIKFSSSQTTANTSPTVETTINTTTTTTSQTPTTSVANTETTSTLTPTTETVATNTTPTTETITKTEGNVNYRVQIGAFTNSAVSANTLTKKFKVTETINSEMQGGFSKFMIGSYAEYKAARDKREIAKNNNGIRSAFVVAYNSGKRITVQEALMISNQKWYK